MTDPFAGAQPRLPRGEGLNAEFYDHARSGTLHLQQCKPHGHVQHPPRLRCRRCGSDELEWAPVDGRGVLYSWTTTHFPFDRGWAAALPYSTGVVELPEGVRIVAALAPDVEPRTDLPVRLATATQEDGSVLLRITATN